MNKALVYGFMVFLLVGVVAAGPKVIVLKLSYDNGDISLLNQTLKYGFAPDRMLQPDNGYRAEGVSYSDESIYSFNFKAPNEMYIDGTDKDGNLSGGRIDLRHVNFGMVVPYDDELKEIKIYSPTGKVVGEIGIENEREISYIRYVLLGLIILASIIGLFFIYTKYRKES